MGPSVRARRRFLDRLGARGRCRAYEPRFNALERSLRSRNRPARRTPAGHALARRHRARDCRACGRGRRPGTCRKQCSGCRRALARQQPDEAFPLPAEHGARTAGWSSIDAASAMPSRSEERYRAILKDNRCRATPPRAARSTGHTSPISLVVYAPDKHIAAAEASTGEQKALLDRSHSGARRASLPK